MAQALATSTDVVALAPELADVDPGLMTVWLGLTAKQVDLEYFEECSSEFHALITAHRLSLLISAQSAGGASIGGQVTSVKEGPASATFKAADLSSMDQDLSRTVYGQMAWEIRCGVDAAYPFAIARAGVLD